MKPIIFNTEMVKAILEGRKTVTRRVVKFKAGKNPNWTGYIKDGLTLYNGKNEPCSLPIPYHVGDILYVRETWHKYIKRVGNGKSCRLQEFYGYKASITNYEDAHEPWKPSIHMPKEAARLFLRVTGVKLERLQDICNRSTPKDHIKRITSEGLEFQPVMENYQKLIDDFKKLWNSTIKKDKIDTYGWNANPYVWVVEFENISEEITSANTKIKQEETTND